MRGLDLNYRVVKFLYSLAKYKITIFLIGVVVFGVIFKYNRQIFFSGDYEITYDYEEKEESKLNLGCGKGIGLKVANSGNKKYPKVIIEINKIPYKALENLCIRSRKMPIGEEYSKDADKQIDIIIDRYDGSIFFTISNLPIGWCVFINVSEPGDDFKKRDWSNIIIEMSGRGSILNENPTKVLIFKKVQKYIGYVFFAFKKISDFFFK